MGWVELTVFGLLVAGLMLGAVASRRIKVGPSGHWIAGWIVLLLSGFLSGGVADSPGVDLLIGLLRPLFPILMLTGAYRYSGMRVPSWIPIGCVVLAELHAFLLFHEMRLQSDLVSLLSAPGLCLTAAYVIHRAVSISEWRGSILQRMLAPSLGVLAAIEVFDAVMGLNDGPVTGYLSIWIPLGVPVSVIQFAATFELIGDRLSELARERDRTASALAKTNRELLSVQQQMEERIVERTAQLREEMEERRRVEKELRVRERRYRTVSELMTDYNYAARVHEDGSFETEWIAGAFSRITGYSAEEAQTLNWLNITHPEDRDGVEKSLFKAIGGDLAEFECRIFTKSGEIRWMIARVAGMRDPETGELVIYTAGHDITDEKNAAIENLRLRDRMREAQKLESLGALAGGIAHDFNNLLSVILGNAAVLIRDLPEGSDLTGRAARIRTSARYAAELTTQMLTYTGDAPIESERIVVSDIVTDMVQLMDAGTNRQVDIDFELSGEGDEIRGDASKIRQVVMNLITNAAEALEDGGGKVTVRTGRIHLSADELSSMQASTDAVAGDYVFLDVSDDGQGMDQETRTRLFEPFYSTKFSGRGLGLAVVLGIVRAHRGAIRLLSRLGEGTRIRVFFPISEELPDAPSNVLGELRPASGTRDRPDGGAALGSVDRTGTVLVIDDEEPVAELTQIFLERAGFDVLVAGGGREGLEIYQKNSDRIVLVLLDLMMPDLGGGEVFSELRQINPRLPVLVTSGYTHEIASRRVGTLERTGFVQKPYEPEDLLSSVAELLSRDAS